MATRARSRSSARGRFVRCTVVLVVVARGWSETLLPIAKADDVSAADTAAARKLGVEGIRLADAGDCEQALDRLSRSERLRHSLAVLERLGECQAAVGRPVEASETLLRVVREPLPPDAPVAFVRAQERANANLPAIRSKIAKLRITVRPAVPATVTLDTEPISSALFDTERPTNPGNHVLEAEAPGYRKTIVQIVLADGEAKSVALDLEPLPASPSAPEARPAPTASPSPSAADARASSSSRKRTPTTALVVLGVGAVSSLVGVGFGIAALRERDVLDDRCPDRTCPSTEQGRLDRARAFGWVSTLGMGLGGVGLVVGSVLWLTGRGEESSQVRWGSVVARPTFGFEGVGLEGRF